MKHLIRIMLLSCMLVGAITFAGDEDPIPLSCVNIAGDWQTDTGMRYNIKQKACSQIRVAWTEDDSKFSTLIVPDGKDRPIKGPDFKGLARHRWNSTRYGTTIETIRTMNFEKFTVTEIVQLERVNQNLMLQSTYRTVRPQTGESYTEYGQVVFRRLATPNQRK